MTDNTTIIRQFYTAFQQKDYKTMQSLYADDAKFSDPVFNNLNSKEVKAMWEMLLTSSTDLRLEFSEVVSNGDKGSCLWQAYYTFTFTGRKVHNIIRANFIFRDGKIAKHHDDFDFWRWSGMALGMSGRLLGWTPLIRNKVKKTARHRLSKFIQQKDSNQVKSVG